MKILITGGAGFIGSHLTDYLLNENHRVTVVDNLSLGKTGNIEHNFQNKNFKFFKKDVLDRPALLKLFKTENFDAVFHMAANSDISGSHHNPDIDLKNTFLSTYNVLMLMKEFQVQNIVFASTSAIYGENREKIMENSGPLFPISHYGAGKLAGEAFISSFCENYGIKAWIIRFPNVAGERSTHGVIFDFINKMRKDPSKLEVLGDGSQIKPYLYVKELVEAMLFVWKNSREKINYFNIGVESRTSVKDIAAMVIEEMGLDAGIVYTGGSRGWIGDVPEFNYGLEKIHKLGWKAKLTSDEAVRMSIRKILKKENP